MPSIVHSKLCNNLTDTRLRIPRRTDIAEEINDASIPFVLLKKHMYARKVCHCFGKYVGELKENMSGSLKYHPYDHLRDRNMQQDFHNISVYLSRN